MEDRSLLRNIRQTPKPSLPVLIISKLVALALPISQLVIGVLYLKECPRQPLVPVYLLVSGVFALVLVVLSCLPCAQEEEQGGGAINTLCTTWNSIVTIFLFCWFIAGNVWVYSIYEPSYDTHTPEYREDTLPLRLLDHHPRLHHHRSDHHGWNLHHDLHVCVQSSRNLQQPY
ncbi:transmembrane protein 272-like [Silurus meridionalis]|uniref:transmembrane protein 272-like n=1 Tax=Silurus meridionalis TaxID=175797 RepID=UPI001EEB71E7|nr:transmembrane protein 272-like [Silurus meridionalis]